MILFGAKGETLELATAYTQITAIGMPFYITGTGCSMYVRADGSPKYARQVLFQLPLILILPLCIGLNGILCAGPIADIAACVLSVLLIRQEFVKADN